jgi:hypothetical protein
MKPIRVTPDSSVEALASIALSVHNAVGRMPIAVKARHAPGVLIEDGEFIISAHECQLLECMFAGESVRRIHIDRGRYMGTTMFASIIENSMGQRVAAIGVVDTLGLLSLEGFVADQESIEQQLGNQNTRDKHLIRNRR